MIPQVTGVASGSSAPSKSIINYTVDRNEISGRIWSALREADRKLQGNLVSHLITEYLKENPDWTPYEIERRLRDNLCYTYLIAYPQDHPQFRNFQPRTHLDTECLYFAICAVTNDGALITKVRTVAGSKTPFENLNKLKQSGFGAKIQEDINLPTLYRDVRHRIEYPPEEFIRAILFFYERKNECTISELEEMAKKTRVVCSKNYKEEKDHIYQELRKGRLPDPWIDLIFASVTWSTE